MNFEMCQLFNIFVCTNGVRDCDNIVEISIETVDVFDLFEPIIFIFPVALQVENLMLLLLFIFLLILRSHLNVTFGPVIIVSSIIP